MNKKDHDYWHSVIKHCDTAIASMIELYGECHDGYEPECVGCRATWFLRDMRELRQQALAALS